MKRILSILTVLSMAALMIPTAGCSGQAGAAAEGGSAGVARSDPATTVKVLTPQRIMLKRTTTQPASIYPYFQAKIYAKTAGYLKELRADIGQKVKKDEILGLIWVPEIEQSVASQQKTIERLVADEQLASAGVELAKANVQAANIGVEQACAEIGQAEAQLAADQAECKRMRELVANKSIAERLLDESVKRRESSEAGKAAAEAAISFARAQVTVSEAKLKNAEAGLCIAQAETSVARAKLEELKTMNAYSELRAPFDGIVTQRSAEPGELVRNIASASESSRQPLFTVAQTDTVRVRVTVPEKDAALVNEGDLVSVQLQALPGRAFEGKLSRSSSSLDESTRTMLVEVDMPNPQGELLPGMYGEATIVLLQKDDALVLPAKSVRYDEQGRSFVYVVAADSVIHKTAVTTGMDDGSELEIVDPLQGNERIIDATLAALKDGQRVSVQN